MASNSYQIVRVVISCKSTFEVGHAAAATTTSSIGVGASARSYGYCGWSSGREAYSASCSILLLTSQRSCSGHCIVWLVS